MNKKNQKSARDSGDMPRDTSRQHGCLLAAKKE